jgi:hypothetical protein
MLGLHRLIRTVLWITTDQEVSTHRPDRRWFALDAGTGFIGACVVRNADRPAAAA